MKKIFCNINLFDLNQQIFLIDIEHPSLDVLLGETEFIDLGKKISAINEQAKVNNVMLKGNKELLEPIVEEILSYSKTKYNNEEIKVEIIE